MGSEDYFTLAMKFVFDHECRHNKDGTLDPGYVNDPHDSGGETKYGVSKRAYPNLDIKNLTLNDALDIYKRDYWPVSIGQSFPMAVVLLDCAVNQGQGFANQVLNKSDGDYKKAIELRRVRYLNILAGKFATNPNRDKYKQSWLNRLNDLQKFIDVHSDTLQ